MTARVSSKYGLVMNEIENKKQRKEKKYDEV